MIKSYIIYIATSLSLGTFFLSSISEFLALKLEIHEKIGVEDL